MRRVVMASTLVEGSEVPLTDAAFEIGRSYRSVLDLLLSRKLRGRRFRGRWVVERESIAQFLTGQQPPAGA
jgi:hypothetical protein